MKKLIGVQDVAVLFDEQLIIQGIKPPTFGTLLTNILNGVQPRNNEESAAIGQILLKLRMKENELAVENADYKVIVEKLNENAAKMFAGYHSQLLLWLQKFEKDVSN
jgi:hypothetical protein